MAYSAYNSTIFQSAAANTACNKIIEALQVAFGINETNQAFAMSGAAASYLQVPTENNNIRNISFVTTDEDMYAFLVGRLSSLLSPSGIIAYKEVIQVVLTGNVYIEIWLITTTLNREVRLGIEMQERDEIPAYLLTYYQPSGDLAIGTPPMVHGYDQIFNPGSTVLYNQSWVFNPAKVYVRWTQGEAVPADIDVATIIKNYRTDDRFSNYSDYEVEVISNIGKGNGLISPWYNATIGGNTVHQISGNPLDQTLNISFVNFQLIDPGKYSANVGFQVSGIDARTGSRGLMDRIVLPIELTVVAPSAVYVKPTELYFEHVVGEALPATQEVVINDTGNYTIKYAKELIVNGSGLIDRSTRDINVKSGSGLKTIMVGLDRTIEDRGARNQSYAISVITFDGTKIVETVVSILDSREIKVVPSSFKFEAIQGVEESPAQAIRISSPLPYTYEISGWLDINKVSGVLGSSFSGFVDPADSENFSPGVYSGEIKLTSDEGTVVVPVTYTIKANSFTDLQPNKINFTKDQLFVNLATKNTGVYLRAVLGLTWYNFKDVATVTEYPQHIPIFNGQAEFHPGEFIHSIMDSLTDIEQFIPTDLESRVDQPFDYYTPASLDISMEQRNYSDGGLVETKEINNLLFVKGTKPNQFANDAGVMLSDYPVRVTPNSYGIINFIKRSGVHNIEVHVNGVLKRNIVHDTVNDSVFGMIFSFHTYKPGDLVYLKIENESDGFFERRFYVFPENKESYHLAWVTEHEQLELLEFTGGYSIETEYERIENSVYKNLVNVKEILQTDKSQPLVANTGWILKDNHVLLDSLMRSKRAWLFLPNTDYKIALVPQGKKLANYDSDQATYAYDIEFTINPDNDAKVYPR